MKIGIDIDEIITEFARGYLRMYNEKYEKNLKFEELLTYVLCEPLKISQEASLKLADEYYNSKHFDKIDLVDGAEEGVRKLNQDHELIFITARPSHIKEKTELFLKKLFPNFNLGVVYSKNMWEEGLLKSEICNNQKCNVLIEDDLRHALECAEKGIRIILFDKPWNQGVSHENLIRANNWNEILEKINELNKIENIIEVKNEQ